jgi:hypothetical protein
VNLPASAELRRPNALAASLTPARRRAVRHAIVLSGVLLAVIAAALSFAGPAMDAHAYWAARSPHLYDALPGQPGAYLYSPAFAQLIAPLQWLPAPVFVAAWLVATMFLLGWLTGPRLLAIAVALIWSEIESANIHVFLAVAIVLGFRFPWTWALILLTKVTPGVGLLWFVRRREWRALAIALGVTGAVAIISFVADPQSWSSWLELLTRSAAAPSQSLSGLTPLWLRLPIAAVLVWWGAGRDARWTVPVAATLALPVIWPGSLALLLAVVPLVDNKWLRPRWRTALA